MKLVKVVKNMAISQERQKQIIEELKAKQAKKAAKEGKALPKQDSGQDELAKLKAENTKLKIKIQKERDSKKELASQLKNKDDSKKYVIENDAVNDILFGNENRIFEKDYEFPIKNSKDSYKFKIKVHMPNAIEVGQISTEYNKMISKYKMSNLSVQAANIFEAIATFKIVGEVCPDWFKDPNKAYRWDILISVYSEVLSWESSFLIAPQES